MGWLKAQSGPGVALIGMVEYARGSWRRKENTQIHKNTKYTKWSRSGTNWDGLLCYRVFKTDNNLTKYLGRKCFDLF